VRNQNGIRVVGLLSRSVPGTRVIGMGLIPSQLDIIEWVEAGASGFILKTATVDDFLETIRSGSPRDKSPPPSLAGSLFSHVIENALKKGKGDLTTAVRMTKREREIVLLIAKVSATRKLEDV